MPDVEGFALEHDKVTSNYCDQALRRHRQPRRDEGCRGAETGSIIEPDGDESDSQQTPRNHLGSLAAPELHPWPLFGANVMERKVHASTQ